MFERDELHYHSLNVTTIRCADFKRFDIRVQIALRYHRVFLRCIFVPMYHQLAQISTLLQRFTVSGLEKELKFLIVFEVHVYALSI